MNNYSPIGVFDSGYGGLTVLQELKRKLPNHDFLYLGDNARTPYGSRSFEVVLEYTWQAVKYLFEQGCDLIILACNTASAKALRSIQQNYLHDFPGKRVLGVIRPSTEKVNLFTKSNQVGVLATKGTVTSNSYPIEINKFFPNIRVHQKACPMWVPLVESGEFKTPEGKAIVERDIKNFIAEHPQVDTIVLACTHFPILLEFLNEIVPENISIISQGAIVADALEDYLSRHTWLETKISKNGKMDYCTTESSSFFKESVKSIFNINIYVNHISWH